MALGTPGNIGFGASGAHALWTFENRKLPLGPNELSSSLQQCCQLRITPYKKIHPSQGL